MLGHEVPPLARACDLVGLLVILASVISICSLGRKSIVSHALQMVRPLEVACSLEHLLERVHHLHGSTEFRSACRITEMHLLVTRPEACRQPECVPDGLQSLLRSLKVLRVMRPLPPDHRLLEAVCQVNRMHGVLCAEFVGLAPEHGCPRSRLAVDQVAELQKEPVTCDVVQPVDHIEIVSASPLAPECPVIERFLGKVCKLIPEVACHDIDHPLVTCSHIILLQYLESDHLRPPVLGLSPLESFDVLAGDPVSEVTVFVNHRQHGLRPHL